MMLKFLPFWSVSKVATFNFYTRHLRFAVTVFALLVLLLLGVHGVVYAQNPIDADVDFFVAIPADTPPFTVGDRITLRLQVIHSSQAQVNLPVVEEQWGDFEVVDQTGQDTVINNDGTAVTRKDIIVSLFEPGQYQTPSLVITHHQVNDTVEELGSPVIPLEIGTVLVEGDEELRDLKEQSTLPVPPLWPFILAGMMLAAVAAGGMFWAGRWAYNRWWVKEPVVVVPQPVIDTRPPELVAFTELERIESLNLPAQNRFKMHYSLVTECLRDYIERRYKISALEQTTDEIQSAFNLTSVSSEKVRKFIYLFKRSDLVKFARFHPTVEEAYDLLPAARHIVQKTTPQPESDIEKTTRPAQPNPENAE